MIRCHKTFVENVLSLSSLRQHHEGKLSVEIVSKNVCYQAASTEQEKPGVFTKNTHCKTYDGNMVYGN